MRIPRVYTPQPLSPGGQIELEEEAAHHVTTVLRMRVGDPISLFDGKGTECAGLIASITRKSVVVDVERCATFNRESALQVTLAQGISRGERMDYTIEKAVELGVAAIVPLLTQRTAVKLDAGREARRIEHWRKVIIGACEQSGRDHLPDLLPVERIENWLQRPAAGLKLLLRAAADTALAAVPRATEVTLLIGPEGGLAAAEVAAAERAGYLPVRLGPRILRTETAALAALSTLQSLWGDFR
ncbi:MAG: 16S rRNA (uracil(1498)-N(3))-methyltransferase [Chromatiales bacterium]